MVSQLQSFTRCFYCCRAVSPPSLFLVNSILPRLQVSLRYHFHWKLCWNTHNAPLTWALALWLTLLKYIKLPVHLYVGLPKGTRNSPKLGSAACYSLSDKWDGIPKLLSTASDVPSSLCYHVPEMELIRYQIKQNLLNANTWFQMITEEIPFKTTLVSLYWKGWFKNKT